MTIAADQDAIGAAAAWIAGVASGTVAVVLATLAIAGVGFSLFTGRLAVRRGGTVLLGIFLLFGAGSIARSLLGAAASATQGDASSFNRAPASGTATSPAGPTNDDRYAHPSLLH